MDEEARPPGPGFSARKAPIRKVGVIGDVHAEHLTLEHVLALFEAEGVDAILCTGDIADGHGDVDLCCEMLQAAKVWTVRGNHDRWALTGEMRSLPHATMKLAESAVEFLRGLPDILEFETTRGPALLCHGVGDDDMAELTPHTRGYGLQAISGLRELMLSPTCYLIGGHTHQPMVRQFVGLTAINAGTLHREFEPSACLVDFVEEEVVRFAIHDSSVGADRWAEPLPRPAS